MVMETFKVIVDMSLSLMAQVLGSTNVLFFRLQLDDLEVAGDPKTFPQVTGPQFELWTPEPRKFARELVIMELPKLTITEAEEFLNSKGLGPAGIPELLAFNRTFPRKKLEKEMHCFGGPKDWGAGRNCNCLLGDLSSFLSGKRFLGVRHVFWGRGNVTLNPPKGEPFLAIKKSREI